MRSAQVSDAHRSIAAALKTGAQRAIWLGALALRHPAYADLRALAAALGAGHRRDAWVYSPKAAMRPAPISPVRCRIGKPGGKAATRSRAFGATEMLRKPLQAYVLFGGVEPWADVAG